VDIKWLSLATLDCPQVFTLSNFIYYQSIVWTHLTIHVLLIYTPSPAVFCCICSSAIKYYYGCHNSIHYWRRDNTCQKQGMWLWFRNGIILVTSITIVYISLVSNYKVILKMFKCLCLSLRGKFNLIHTNSHSLGELSLTNSWEPLCTDPGHTFHKCSARQ